MIVVALKDILDKRAYRGTLRDLADDIGYNREKVRRFAAGEMKLYPHDLLNDLCGFLDCTVEDLLSYKADDLDQKYLDSY